MGKYTDTNLRFKTIYCEVNSSRHKGGHPLHLAITKHLKVRFGRKHESRPIKIRVSWRFSLVCHRSCRKYLTSAKFCEHTCQYLRLLGDYVLQIWRITFTRGASSRIKFPTSWSGWVWWTGVCGPEESEEVSSSRVEDVPAKLRVYTMEEWKNCFLKTAVLRVDAGDDPGKVDPVQDRKWTARGCSAPRRHVWTVERLVRFYEIWNQFTLYKGVTIDM